MVRRAGVVNECGTQPKKEGVKYVVTNLRGYFEIDAAAEEWDPGHILRVNREQRVEIARMRAEIARMRGMLASNRRDFTDGWVACAEYRGVDIDHDALERALDAELADPTTPPAPPPAVPCAGWRPGTARWR